VPDLRCPEISAPEIPVDNDIGNSLAAHPCYGEEGVLSKTIPFLSIPSHEGKGNRKNQGDQSSG
jgi:hypothetical protein